jgi:aspartate/methionine/tyrosine aminotransferase
MFSSRLNASAEVNRITRRLRDLRATGVPILDLTESNPTRAGIRYPAGEIAHLLSDARALAYEPQPAGLPAAREAVAGYYAQRGETVDPARILLTASTSEGYAYLFKVLADPGDEVVVPRPSYPLFEFLAALESVRIVQYPLVYDGAWAIDFDALNGAITPRTRAIVVVNPNNPTGSFLKLDERGELIRIGRDHRLAIVSDEVFSDYAFEDDPRRARTLTDTSEVLSFSLSGLSKVAGLPQLKLGWMTVNGPSDLRREAFERLEFIADTYLSVSTPVQWAASGLLAWSTRIQSRIQMRCRRNLAVLRRAFGPESAFRVLNVEGGWYAIVQAPRIRSEEEWVLLLLERHGVLVQPGFFYDFEAEAFLVVSLLTPKEVFSAGIKAWATGVAAHAPLY